MRKPFEYWIIDNYKVLGEKPVDLRAIHCREVVEITDLEIHKAAFDIACTTKRADTAAIAGAKWAISKMISEKG